MVSISIIMPLYNAGKYLKESLKSVQNQTFADYELICINDASTDATMDILQSFQREDGRIRIFTNKEHSGAAISRNRGIQEARGKYITFLDGDDIFEEEMLECAYGAAETYHTDVIAFGLAQTPSDNIYQKQRVNHSDIFYGRYSDKAFQMKDYMPYEFAHFQLCVEGKLIKKEFIVSNHLKFQDLSCANDVYFICMAILLAEKLLYLRDDRVMVYQREHNEPTRISYDRDPKCTYLAFLHVMEELKNRGKFSEVREHYFYRFFLAVRNALLVCKTEEKAQLFYQFLQEEGIDAIYSPESEYYDKLDVSIRNLLTQFKTREFHSKWYTVRPGLEMQLNQKYNIEALTGLFAGYKALNKRVGVWGVGENGIAFLKFCNENGLNIDMVIDKSIQKQGKNVEGYLVEPPGNIGSRLQVIIVTARFILESVKSELAEKDVEVIDINQFLYLY